MRQMRSNSFASAKILFLSLFISTTLVQVYGQPLQDLESEFEYDTRPHDVGLNRFYTAEYKRLPVYDFGLGKRFDPDENSGYPREYEDYPYVGNGDDDDDSIPELDFYHDDSMQTVEKRPNPYNFGLGKRQRYDFGLGKRGHHKYDFGLGKRAQNYRERIYNMGLGKRTRVYSFGLGKRPSQNQMGSRFNFGLGKRSDEEFSKNQIAKRDVYRTENLEKAAKTNDTKEQTSTSSHLTKRSLYSMASSDDSSHRNGDGFSRQFRDPLYNFGLGKRTFFDIQKTKSSNN